MRLLKIGRDATNNIVLHSEKVSSLHAELTLLDSGDIQLEDKNSRNGTFIMNQRIQPGKPVNVRRGDAIRFADVELQWSQVPMPEDNSAYKGIYGVGSNFNNDIQISGATVSRYHATIKLGRDNKMYIIDHSKNGTTVDGVKIGPNQPYRIKKSSAVVCGGVPVDTSRLPWPKQAWKTILAVAATLIVVAGAGFGIWKWLETREKVVSDTELYERYNHSVVMLMGIYHYDVTVGDWTKEDFDEYYSLAKSLGALTGEDFRINSQLVFDNEGDLVFANEISSKKLIEDKDKKGDFTGTGFFISQDGKLITNLHVVKPWLFSKQAERLQDMFSKRLAKFVDFSQNYRLAQRGAIGSALSPSDLMAYVSQVKVTGVLDYIALIPQGEVYDPDNIIKCRVVSAGDDPQKDVALIQTISKRLPTSDCTYVNVVDSMDISPEALAVGRHIYTLGFPTGTNYAALIQKEQDKNGLQVIGQGGTIIQQNSEFDFGHNAPTTGGASGSPIFNDHGMLIGVHHEGLSKIETQGYNYGVKAKYIKELLDEPNKQ